MKDFKLLKGVPLNQQMTYGGALAILISIAASGFNTLVYYWGLLPEASQTMRETGLSVQDFYHNGLILNGVLALVGLFLLLTGLFVQSK